MILRFLFTSIFLFISIVFAESDAETRVSPRVISETVESREGTFTVRIDGEKKKIEVKRVAEPTNASPHLRIKIFRERDRPLEVRLRALDSRDRSLYYSGKSPEWSGSMIGAQLEFSFDKKTWKKLGDLIQGVIP